MAKEEMHDVMKEWTVDFSLYQLGQVAGITDQELLPLARDIVETLQNKGVIYLTNTGLPVPQVETAQQLSQQFFDLEDGTKQRYLMNPRVSIYGYVGLNTEWPGKPYGRPKDHKEAVNVNVYDKNNVQPDQVLAGFTKTMYAVTESFNDLGIRVMECIGLGTNLGRHCFDGCMKGIKKLDPTFTNGSALKLLSYPAIPDDQDYQQYIRCGEHTDFGLVTLSLQDNVGGLQVQSSNGAWLDVPYVAGSVVVITGDMLEILLSGRIKPVLHRVIIKDREGARKIREGLIYFMMGDNGYLYKGLDGSTTHPAMTMAQLTQRYFTGMLD